MGRTIGVYTIPRGIVVEDVIRSAIVEMAEAVDELYIAYYKKRTDIELPYISNATIVLADKKDGWMASLMGSVARQLVESTRPETELLVISGAQILGPFDGIQTHLSSFKSSGADVYAPMNYLPQFEIRSKRNTALLDRLPDRVLSIDFLIVGARVLSNPDFWQLLQKPKDRSFEKSILPSIEYELQCFLDKNNYSVHRASGLQLMETTTPWLFEPAKYIQNVAQILSMRTIYLPLEWQDLYAIDLRGALDEIKQISSDAHDQTWRYMLRTMKLRNIHAMAEEMEVIGDVHVPQQASQKNDPELIAVFVHAYYAEMINEFWGLLERIDLPKKVFITTATSENQTSIISFLSEKGLAPIEYEVRVVEQNRGRDMSSLFITFRDVILSDQFDICLRLHSKRTPQVPRQVGRSFKDHLFDNLVSSPGYVRNVVDYMRANRNVGLMMPPTIHIGFGTLGHSWFNNRKGVHLLAREMDLNVPLDDDTPLAPYGTMYWFRSKALRRMFEHEWQWEDYNAEPLHVDGGLAHLQERLIGYVAQDAGYRVVSIMNARDAAKNYAKLEFKMQLLTAKIPHAHIIKQSKYLKRRGRYMVGGFKRLKRYIRDNIKSAFKQLFKSTSTY